MRDPGPILILGAGPTGLGAAYRLAELGCGDFRVLEAREQPGGLASSFLDDHGFTWDVGGHVQHSHYRRYDRMIDRMLGDERLWHERQSWVWLSDRFVPYPFQYNLHRLDAEDRRRALAGLEAAAAIERRGDRPPPGNFLEWIERTFGAGIAEIFMVPYNAKVWGYPLETLGGGWIGDRVAVPDLERIRRNTEASRDDVGWGPNRRFFFPLRGGTGSIWRRLAASLEAGRVELGATVTAVDLEQRTVSLAGGRQLPYGTLITSLPLDVLAGLTRGLDPAARRAARSLVYSSCHILGVGLRGAAPASLRRKCWLYFPAAESPYYRVTVFSNYSPHNAPEGCWSLMAEVCDTVHSRPGATPHRRGAAAALGESVVAALRRDGLIAPGAEIVSLWHRLAGHGYPTPFLGRDQVLDRILPALERHRVYSRGRFGAWKYEVSNQDHSFMQGVEVVDRILGLGEEVTLPHPEIVNR